MSRRTLLALGIVQIVLLLALMFGPRNQPVDFQEERAVLAATQPILVQEVAITVDGATHRFQASGEGAWTNEERALPAARSRSVSLLLTFLEQSARGRELRDVEHPQDFGLGDAAVHLEIATQSGTHELRFGKLSPWGDQVYARDMNDPPGRVFLAQRDVRRLLADVLRTTETTSEGS